MVKLPELRKKIHSFLTKEDGKISKDTILKAGAILGAIALGSAKGAKAHSGGESYGYGTCTWYGSSYSYATHQNTMSTNYADNQFSGSHSHHGNHCSHASHGSHGSHGSATY